jgi:hypothetical protein
MLFFAFASKSSGQNNQRLIEISYPAMYFPPEFNNHLSHAIWLRQIFSLSMERWQNGGWSVLWVLLSNRVRVTCDKKLKVECCKLDLSPAGKLRIKG